LWQGLAQLAVGLTHVLRGNPAGARTLLTRGRDRIERYVSNPPYDVYVVGLTGWATAFLETLDEVGAQERAAAPRLRLDPSQSDAVSDS
ncbi:MAG TPA: DUF309 domain-containing protein, partial [Propionibacteriaceae bacterium]